MQGLAIDPGEPRQPAGCRQERGQGQRPEPALRRLPLARPAAGRLHQLAQRAQLLRRSRRARRRHARRTSRRSSRPTTRRTTRCSWSRATSTPPRRCLDQEVLRPASRPPPCPPSPTSPSRARSEEKRAVKESTRRRPGRPRRRVPRAAAHAPPSTSPWASSTRSSCRARTAVCTRPWSRRRATPTRSRAASTPNSATCSTSTAPRSSRPRSSTTRARRRRHPRRLRRRGREAAHGARRPGHLDLAKVKIRSWLYGEMEELLRFREGRPARLVRALRRRPGEDQRPRGRVRQGDAGAHPEDRAGVPAHRPTAPFSPYPGSPSLPGPEAGRVLRKDIMNKTLRLLALAAGLAPRDPPWPRPPRRKRRPRPRPPRDFALPAPKQFVLANGLTRHAGPLRQHPQGRRRPARGRGQQLREGRRGLARRPHRPAHARRHGHETGAQLSKAAAQMGGQVDVSVGADTASVSRLLALRVRSRPGEARGRSRADTRAFPRASSNG